MKKLFISAFMVIVLLVLGIVFNREAQGIVRNITDYSPCNEPIAYSVGVIDEGFVTTREELLEDIKTAASIWSNTQGRQLFVYDPKSTFTINMVYDDRQELNSKISDLNSDLKEKQSEIDPKIEEFKKRQSEFEAKVDALNERISYWNRQGGAPKEEYDKLVSDQQALQKEASELNQIAEELGQTTKEYNANARILNNTIDDYKEVLVDKPEEGLYEQEGNSRKISIYIDAGDEEFLHTLTHELGHALGIEHVNDPKAIMYPQTNNSLTPTSAEIDQLNYICRSRTIFEEAGIRIQEVAEILRGRIESRN